MDQERLISTWTKVKKAGQNRYSLLWTSVLISSLVSLSTILTVLYVHYKITMDRIHREGHLLIKETNMESVYYRPQFDFDPLDLYEYSKVLLEKGEKHVSHEEATNRFRIFLDNKEKVKGLQQEAKGSVKYGTNEMSDWTDEEFQKILLPKDSYKDLRKTSKFIKTQNVPRRERGVAYPDHFDWREKGDYVTPVKAQLKCGSCWAFATAATVECAYAVGNKELRSLSEQELLDCNLDNNACDGGDVDKALAFIYDRGLMTEDGYPYVAHRQNVCRIDGDTTKIKAAYFLNQDENSIIDWLVNFGPVNIGMSVTQPMRYYKGGVFYPPKQECDHKVIGLHSMLIVGYGQSNETETEESQKYWIIKNSWGPSFGIENGYIHFIRGENACGMEDEPIGVLA